MNANNAYYHLKLLRIITITGFLAFMPFCGVVLARYPEIKKPVNDYAGIISHHYEKRISDLIIGHREKTGVQIAVLTVRSTGTMRIEDYSLDIAQKWGGGSRDRDDGLLFVIAVKDRRMRLEVGDGLRGYIPDSKAQEILDHIKNDFRRGAYGRGILTVMQSIIGETALLRAGEPIPVFRRIMGSFYRTISFYFVYFLFGIMLGGNFTWYRDTCKGKKKKRIITFAGIVIVWLAITLLIFLYFRRVWFWEPIVYLGGVIGGSGVVASFKTDELMRRTANGIMLVTTVINLALVVYVLDVLGPHTVTRSEAEIGLAVFFPMICLSQLFFWPMMLSPTGAHSSYSSGSSSSSYSSFSSGSSSSSSWSGGGGSFSGGGATASW